MAGASACIPLTPVMGALDRLQTALRVALGVLALGLAAAIVGGIALAPPPPLGFAAVQGRALLRRTGTGAADSTGDAVRFRQRAIGVGLRCDGRGRIRVVLHPFGEVESTCRPGDTSDGGFVLSGVSADTTTWEVRTGAQNRWSLVLTQPAVDGAGSEP